MSSPGNRHGNANSMGVANLAQELQWVKSDCALIRNAVVLLEQEKDNLRQAVRKLKLENQRVKDKVKRLQTEVKKLGGNPEGDDEEDMDYDDLGRGDFLLIGGVQDPLSLRFEVTIRDDDGMEHKSAERYYWYKLAEHFGDKEAMKRIVDASTTPQAEEAMKEVKGFNEDEWGKEKLRHWERGQQLKMEQVRWITCLLVETGDSYIAVAHQDKQLGTGWRKNREESNKPIFWDGKNQGGKFLMKYRKQLKDTHEWAGPNEKEETRKKLSEMKRFVWRRVEQQGRSGMGMGQRGGFIGGRGGGMNNARGRGSYGQSGRYHQKQSTA